MRQLVLMCAMDSDADTEILGQSLDSWRGSAPGAPHARRGDPGE